MTNARPKPTYVFPARQKKLQLVSVTDGQSPVEKGVGEPVTPQFIPLADGIGFRLKSAFVDAVSEGIGKATFWTGLPFGAPLGHPNGAAQSVSRKLSVLQFGPRLILSRLLLAAPNTHRTVATRTAAHVTQEFWLIK
jgi:hypothetical protein